MSMRSAASSPFHVVDSHIMNHSPPIVMNARDHNNITEINRKGITAIKPELDLIAALRSKAQLAEALAHIHSITFALAANTDSGSGTALFGFASGQDLDDASRVVAVVDQDGLGLPDLIQYARVSESLRLQEGATHGAGECLWRLVEVRLRRSSPRG